MKTLAFVQGEGNLLQGSSVILITPSVRPEIMLAVDDLSRRNLHPIVVLLDANSFGGAESSDALVASLQEANVPLCYIHCGADLESNLSGLTTNYSYQETAKWFEPSTL